MKIPFKFQSYIFRQIVLLFLTYQSSACTTLVSPQSGKSTGITEEYRAFVPAKVLVFPCQPWEGAGLPPADRPALAKTICEQADTYILGSFRNQPYMSGFSPAALRQLAEQQQDPELLQWAEKLRALVPAPGESAPESALHLYRDSLAIQPTWLAWLSQMSRNMKYADAALFPLLYEVSEEQIQSRGLQASRRGINLVLFLVDTSNGKIIWSGESAISAENKDLQAMPTFPDWEPLIAGLWSERLWIEYPGRITQKSPE
jgi:hypothetical protein